MELIDNTVWIISGKDCFALFSSKAYAEAYKKSLIEKWEKSIIRDDIPKPLKNRANIEKYAKNYPDVIHVGGDHYELFMRESSSRNGTVEYWQYELLSNADWERYRKQFVSSFVIEDHVILL